MVYETFLIDFDLVGRFSFLTNGKLEKKEQPLLQKGLADCCIAHEGEK